MRQIAEPTVSKHWRKSWS